MLIIFLPLVLTLLPTPCLPRETNCLIPPLQASHKYTRDKKEIANKKVQDGTQFQGRRGNPPPHPRSTLRTAAGIPVGSPFITIAAAAAATTQSQKKRNNSAGGKAQTRRKNILKLQPEHRGGGVRRQTTFQR